MVLGGGRGQGVEGATLSLIQDKVKKTRVQPEEGGARR